MWPECVGGWLIGGIVVVAWACIVALVEFHARGKAKRDDREH